MNNQNGKMLPFKLRGRFIIEQRLLRKTRHFSARRDNMYIHRQLRHLPPFYWNCNVLQPATYKNPYLSINLYTAKHFTDTPNHCLPRIAVSSVQQHLSESPCTDNVSGPMRTWCRTLSPKVGYFMLFNRTIITSLAD